MKTVSYLFVGLALVMTPVESALAASKTWNGADGGFWFSAANWSPSGVPVNGDDVIMGTVGFGNVTANFTSTYTLAGLNSLTINATNVGVFTLNQTAGAMIATTETIGSTVNGNVYTQSGGTNTTTTLYLGFGNGGFGNYNLSGAGVLNGGTEFIGYAGTGAGVFAQSGGTNNVTGSLIIGQTSTNSSNAYNLSGGTINFTGVGSFLVGNAGNGTFSQSGGTVTTLGLNVGLSSGGIGVVNQTGGTTNVNGSGLISLGTAGGASGSYTMDTSAGASALNATILRIGDGGTGTFTQNAGIVTIGAVVTIGRLGGSTGTYNLNGGTLVAGVNPTAANFFVGASGTGTMNQTGGTFTVAGGTAASLSLGSTGGNGTYNLSGGSIVTPFLQPGNGGTGAFNQTGGTVNATQMNISTLSGSNGSYNLSGAGTVTLGVSNFEAIGVSAVGTFTQNGGTHTLGGDLQLGQNASGSGTYNLNGGTFNIAGSIGLGQSGSGLIQQTGGALTVNNGVYIGSAAGSNGIYALSGGSVVMANLSVGNNGSGSISQSGGTLNATTMVVGTQFNNAVATGSYTQTGGTVSVSNVLYLGIGGAPSTYSLSGSGVLNAPNSPNTFNDLLIFTNGTFTQSGGTVNGYVLNAGQFNFHSGTFNGTLENGANGTATFDSFVYFGSGLKNHGTLNIPGGQVGTVAGQTFLNDGTVNLSASGQIYSNGPIINNGLITGTGSIGGSSTFVNNLSIVQGAGTLTFNFAPGNATNNGTITLATGRALNLSGGLTNAGDFEINGASIIQNGILTNSATGTVAGPGFILAGFANSGIVTPGPGTLNIANAWTNAGVVQLSGITSNVTGGAITNTGTIQGLGNVGAAVTNSTGIIEAIGGTLVVGGALTNSAGGTLTAGVGNKLLVTNGLATNAGLLNLTGGTFDNNNRALTNSGQISGYGTFRTGGAGLTNAGSVTFTGGVTTVNGNVTNNAGQTIRVSYNPATFTGNVINNGTFKTTSTTATFAGTFTNNGVFTSDPATQQFQNLNIGTNGALQGGVGDVFVINGHLNNQSLASTSFDIAHAQLTLSTGAHDFTWSAVERGATASGYDNNFVIGTFELQIGATLNLLGAFASGPANALYVHGLSLDGGLAQLASIHSNGLNIYYDGGLAENAYLAWGTYALEGGGSLIAVAGVPEPGTVGAFIVGAFGLLLVGRRFSRRVP